jgi:HAD superfamily hydrolase (TIGR01490 family)
MGAAFFDLDKTLIARNSGSLWVRSELRGGYISRWEFARASWLLFRYHLGFAAVEDAVLEAIASLAGDREVDVRGRTHAFYDREVHGLYRPGGRAALEAHREAGDQLVLCTTSSNYLSERVSETLGLDHYICNSFEVDAAGVYTGKPVGTLCFGEGKVVRARAWAGAHGIDLADCAAYTDSVSDLPLLEAVGRPVAVNPDPKLRRAARERGWPIEDWGVPAELAAAVEAS